MIRPLLVWTAAALLAGCAGVSRPATPGEVRARLPALEARAAASPGDAAALRELGRAYARLGDLDRAADVLDRAERASPGDAATAYARGLVDEARGRPALALARYRTTGGAGPYGPLLAGRRARLEAQRTRAEVDSLLDAERYPTVGDDAAVVFPLRFRGDPALRPLARGLTALLAEDVGALGLRVVGAGRVQATLDALGLGPDDVDADRARRLARVLQGDHVVLGSVDAAGDSLRAEAALWEWDAAPAPVPAEAAGALDDLFQVEAALVDAFAERAGVALSDAERDRLAQPPTRSVAAFVQYGRGLAEEDAGRYAEAAALYDEAARLDPAFRQAADRAAVARTLEAASGDVDVALAAVDRLGPSVGAVRLVGQRLTHANQALGVHTPAPGGERVPTAEVPLTPPSDPLPLPPAPPGRNQTPR
ncbi:tetratricopeptide repeat protein [Rubrivirga litoralis]|uniref:Tetratricopeptide repeat protein n=1 Tax=Rubrivirga litoralis TaxID=3075598 RepID=A0ABU3BLQ8_9BACT|nr:tetratricopeptide repeat protein [Rubrivirga sp. F394]MDT0630219.1 tetratricopeptide repeat protein [Rubrivirga sp. F394]